MELGEGHHFRDESKCVKLGLRGPYYAGLFQRGLPRPNGIGRIVHTVDDSLYEGMIVDGAAQGFGRLLLPTGEHFVGYFKAGKLNGLAAKYDNKGSIVSRDFYVNGKSLDELQ